MKKIITLLFILSIVIVSNDVQAQKKKSKKNGDKAQVIDEDQSRVQFDVGFNPQQVSMINLDTNGILLVYTLYSDQTVYINKYDKNLNKIYSTTLAIADKSKIASIKDYKQNLYLLVIDDNYYASSSSFTMNYKVIEFNHISKKSSEVEGVFEKKRMVQDLIPCDGGAFLLTLDCYTNSKMGNRTMFNCCLLGIPSLFGFTKFPFNPYLVSINFKNKKTEEQLLEYVNQSAILAGDLDEEKQELNLSIKNKVKKKENRIYVANYKLAGIGKATKVKETEVDLPDKKDFYSAKINTLNSDEKLVFGTYGPETNYLTQSGGVANGLYLSKVVKGKCAFTTVVRFDELESYMTKNQKKKKDAGAASSKKEKSYSGGVLFHDIIEDENQFILTAENYYPTYHTESYYNYQTKSYTTRQVFDGYLYDKLIILGFTKDGKKKWEQNIKLPYYRTFTPGALLVRNEIVEADLYFTMALSDGAIKFVKLTKDNTVSQLTSLEEIENIDGDEVIERNFINGGVLYENNYIVYGWEKIVKEKDGKKNKSTKDAKTVVFINKIAVYPE